MPSFIDVCERAARAGGAILAEQLGKVEAREKHPSDFVTDADLASQVVIRDIVLSAFPDHGFIGEEEGQDQPDPDREFHWVADPLDGTTNFVHRIPHFCVSLALIQGDRPIVGVVYDPVFDRCFVAQRGDGAQCNGEAIRSSNITSLSGAAAAVGFPASVRRESPDLHVFLAAIERCQTIRRTGSSALNLSYIGAGWFDAMWCFGVKIWDVAAGVLIVEEAGGVVSNYDGSPLNMFTPRLVAGATPQVHDELLGLIAEAGVRFDD